MTTSDPGHPLLRTLDPDFSLYRFAADHPLPGGLAAERFVFLARTDEELSVLCPAEAAEATGLAQAQGLLDHSSPWSGIAVLGPLDFSIVGLLADLSQILAEAQISLFAVSTFDTDYLFVRQEQFAGACDALSAGGYQFERTTDNAERSR